MSDYYYKLIPTIPDYVPDNVARESARERFEAFVGNAAGVTTEVREHVEFVDCMGNFESVSCPVCGTLLNDDWWEQAMDAAYSEQGFVDLRVTVPCCGATTSLNDLIYTSRRASRASSCPPSSPTCPTYRIGRCTNWKR